MRLASNTTVPAPEGRGYRTIHSYDVPTNSLSPQSSSCSGKLKNSIAGALALLSAGVPTIVFDSPTNHIIGQGQYSQSIRNNYQTRASNYVLKNELAVNEFIESHPETAIFLKKITSVIQNNFGLAEITLESWTSPVDSITKLYLTVQSNIDNEDTLMDSEIKLFSEIENN